MADTVAFGTPTLTAADVEQGGPLTQIYTFPATIDVDTTATFLRGVAKVYYQERRASEIAPLESLPVQGDAHDFGADNVTAASTVAVAATILVTEPFPAPAPVFYRYRLVLSWDEMAAVDYSVEYYRQYLLGYRQ